MSIPQLIISIVISLILMGLGGLFIFGLSYLVLVILPKKEDNVVSIRPCTCYNASQNEMYGANQRLWNSAGKAEKPMWRCTVCKKEIQRTEKGEGQ